MRQVRKSRTPADVAKDGHAVRSLQKAEQDLHAELKLATANDHARRARSNFDDLHKGKLRGPLLDDQRHLCVYCEVRIDDSAATTVEHWIPVAAEPERALEWENLYASCQARDSCDGKKSDQRLAWDAADAGLPWPTQAQYERWLGFTSGGEVYVRQSAPLNNVTRRALLLALDDQPDGSQVRRSILGLNHPALCAARKARLDQERSLLSSLFPGKRAPDSERRRRAEALVAANVREEFVSIRMAWLNRELGKDRP